LSVGEFRKRITKLCEDTFTEYTSPDDIMKIIEEARKEFPRIVGSMYGVESVDNKLRFANSALKWFVKYFGDEEETTE